MWNAGVPYILKQFIDVISQPGLVFGFDPERGYTGLLKDKKAAVIYTSAVYGPGAAPRSVPTSSARSSTTGCAGRASTTSPRSSSAPTSPRRTPTPAAARPTPPPGTRGSCSDVAPAAGQIRNRYAVLPGATSWIFSGLAFIRPHSGS